MVRVIYPRQADSLTAASVDDEDVRESARQTDYPRISNTEHSRNLPYDNFLTITWDSYLRTEADTGIGNVGKSPRASDC